MQAAVQTTIPIRRYVDVRQRPTVVRLDALDEAADWITSSFYVTRDIRDHLHGLVHALQQPCGCGTFLIGQYGAGKSHWLAYVTRQLRGGQLLPDPPEVVALSLLHYRATSSLEDIVGSALGIPSAGDDRRGRWVDVQSRKPRGLLLVLDEVSEFLRSKPDQRAFNEDVRFLQFMGEWAQSHAFWVVAAMQEGIEHAGELEHGLYRKIKDRFPLRFLLSPSHVKDLIQESILIKKEGYHGAVGELVAELQQPLPDAGIDYGELAAMYPLHPATLQLLEEVRDRFSQARGVVDFTVTQLGGDAARRVESFLDRPWGSLLTPDLIVDHFRDLFEFQPEFIGLSQQFFPYYGSQLPELFSSPPVRELAGRVLNLLVLTYLSPARDGLDVREAASWLLFRAARIDPQKNLEILGRILRQLVERGRYVVQRGERYCIELRDDGTAALDAFLEREKAELKGRGESVLELLAEQLGDQDFNPLSLPRDQWQERTVQWRFHERPYVVYVGNESPPPAEGVRLCIRLPWGAAGPAPGAYTLRPAPLAVGEELLELAALLRARSRAWSRDAMSRLEGRLTERLSLFRSQLRAAYRDVEVTGPSGAPESPPRVDAASSVRAWLDQFAQWMMQRRYPAFEQFAPGHGPLPKEAYRSLMRFAAQGELGEYDADDYVKLIREAYLVPMRLLARQGRGYVVPSNLDRNELVTLIRPMLDVRPPPARIYEHAAASVYGLTPDQTGLMLVFLHILGEVDILKARKSYREMFETLPDPQQYDQVAPCSALNLDQLHALEILCEGLHVREPKEWTVLAQRRIVRQLQDAVSRQVDPLRSLLARIQEEDQVEALAGSLRQLLSWAQTLRQGNDELSDVQQFLFEIGSPRRFLGTLTELRGLPERFDRILNERKRFQHLFHHPALAAFLDPPQAIRMEALQTAPRLEQLDDVEQWLKECRSVYDECKQEYRRRHEAWWQRMAADPIWNWQPPRLASSRHVGISDLLLQFVTCRQRAERHRCTGLVNLDFQPLCACGFDGRSSPVEDELARMRSLGSQVEQAVAQFFQQEPVRDRIRHWVEQGLETNPHTLAYLRGDEPLPDVSNLELLDRHLAGVEVVKELDAAPLVELLCERTWEKNALQQALAEFVSRIPAAQLRFRRAGAGESSELVEWSVQQVLRFGIPLPQPLRGRVNAEMAERIRPEWVGSVALAHLDELGLGDKFVERIVRWILEGQISLPQGGAEIEDPPQAAPPARRKRGSSSRSASRSIHLGDKSAPLVAAAIEVLEPSCPGSAGQLADLTARLYSAHHVLSRVAGPPWLDRLEALARTPLPPVPRLHELLVASQRSDQHLLIDCLGAGLLPTLRQELDALFPDWKLKEILFARVNGPTTTDAFHRQLVEVGFQQKLEKINVVDALVHGKFLPFDDFARMAMAELAIACRSVRSRLDPCQPLVVFSDHGFRIAPDGRSYVHGGDSTLEQLVPVLYFQPR
jgi:hypothetical protein